MMDIYGYHTLYVPSTIQKINVYKILVGQPEDKEITRKLKVKVNQSRYGPGVAHRVPGS